MKDYNSVLRFLTYKVNEVTLKCNEEFVEKNEGTPINLSIIPTIKVEDKKMDITLKVEIFKNARENNYPFEMIVEITGFFETEGESPDKFVKNAIAILYPYVRAIVSTYTASANVNPLILPAINVNKLIEDQENNKED